MGRPPDAQAPRVGAFAEPVYDTFAFIQRRDARISPASREFLAVAEARLRALAAELEEKPPRSRLPEVA